MTTAESQLLQYYLTNFSLSCPPISYLESYEFFKLVMNILTPISLILGFYGIFLILKATPKEMASAKWVILNSHVSSFYLGSFTTVLTRQFIFFPTGVYYASGLLLQIGVPFRIAIILSQTAYPIDGISMVMLFENRYTQISNHRLLGFKAKFAVYFLHYLFFIVLYTIHLIEPIDEPSVKLEALKTIPCPDPHFFSSDFTYVMTTNVARHSEISGFESIYFFSLAHFFSICSGYYLMKSKSNSTISEKTRSMQKRFLLALTVQSVVPSFVLFLPLLFYLILTLIGTSFHGYGATVVICVALHGITSSFLLIVLHKPYRQYTVQICRKKNVKEIGGASRIFSKVSVN